VSPNRFILLLVTLSLLAILVASNWSVGLSLSFLGMQTRSLPLGIWLLLGFTIGLAISLVLQFLKLPEPKKSDRPPKQKAAPRNYKPPQTNDDDDSDWEAEPPPKSEEWDFDEEEFPQDRNNPNSASDYEVEREPTSQNVSGSVYSYSYRQPQDTGAGRSEAVREANYRVIDPPSRETPADEDDWGFDFDEEESDRR
jgi:uncharacterized integral membrane protein